MTGALKSGDLVAGRFKILGELGRGAMGVVYKAHDESLAREVALKTIRFDILGYDSDAGDFRERFLREARTAARLAHPNIVTIFDVGEWEGTSYMAIEYLKGVTLQELLRPKQPLPVGEALRIGSQTCRGLEEAHSHGIVHRDVKPANIMLVKNNQVKITDFGIAKMESSATLTRDGAIVGTPSYMSPEQLSGKPVDGRSDIFATGAVLYEMLTGEGPFTGTNITSVILKVVSQEPEPARGRNPSLPPGIDAIIEKALQKDPNQRYQTMGELATDLEHLSGGSTEATLTASAPPRAAVPSVDLGRGGPVEPAVSAKKSGKGLLIGAGVALLVVAVVAGVVVSRALRKEPPPAPIPAASLAPALPAGPSIAVLPFEGKGGSTSLAWLQPGLAILFEADLSQSQRIKVVTQEEIAAAAAEQGIDLSKRLSSDSIKALGKRLQVRTILTGSFDVTGNVIRFDVYLYEAETGKILVTDYEKAEGEAKVMGGVDNLTIRVRDALGALPDAAAGDPDRDVAQVLTGSRDALKAFVEGRAAMAAKDYPRAIECFKKATEKDPTFAAAHAKLSQTYASMGKGELERQALREAEAKAKAKAEEDTKTAELLKQQERSRLEEMRKRAEGRQVEEGRLKDKAEHEARQMAEAERKKAPPPSAPPEVAPPSTAAAPRAETLEPEPARVTVKEGDLVEPGNLTVAPQPVQKAELRISPELARRGEQHGLIILSVLIGTKGRVEDAKVLRSDVVAYNEAARESVRKWTFTVPEKDGVKVRTWFSVTMRF